MFTPKYVLQNNPSTL